MIPLYTDEDLKNSKSLDLLPLKCKQCGKTFYNTKHQIKCMINPNHTKTGDCCSKECKKLYKIKKVKVKDGGE
jgi:uncharacterized Zn-finger protein